MVLPLPQASAAESILYASLPGDVVVVRVCGRGNHHNSLSLREVANLTATAEHIPAFVFDLEKCPTMDSTFMGVLASLALRQMRQARSKSTVVNANPHVRELLTNLGLKHVLEIRDQPGLASQTASSADSANFTEAAAPQLDKVNRIILMIEAHEKLIDADSGNEAQFKGVIQSLKESLQRARSQP